MSTPLGNWGRFDRQTKTAVARADGIALITRHELDGNWFSPVGSLCHPHPDIKCGGSPGVISIKPLESVAGVRRHIVGYETAAYQLVCAHAPQGVLDIPPLRIG